MPFHEKFYSASLPDMENIDFLSVLDQLDDGVIIADTDGIVLFYNAAQSKIDGLSPEDALGRKVTDIYELNNRTSIIMQVIYQKAAIKNRAFFYRSCSGKVANTITSAYPLSKNSRVNGVICFVKDYELLYRSTPMSCATDCRPDLGNGTQYTFADLIGTGPDFQRVVGTARKAAVSTSPIMIQGETGTGKELFAQAIHNHSPRRNSRYVAVNCAAIPHDLLEGMLFGTVRGAFTGAMDKPGLFETAHGGTLFLDELLSMPVELQAKLLRVLQEKRVQRLGAVKETPVNVRIISSISQDPRSAIRQEKLRTDLFYRLGVVMVKLPPLRHRRESMNELISHFIDKYNTRLGTHVRYISQEVLDLFLAYRWPGNVRELAHLIEGAMNMAGQEETIGIKHFSPGLDCMEPVDFTCQDRETHDSGGIGNGQNPDSENTAVNINLVKTQNDNEKNAVRAALEACSGNVTKAAETLGISRQLLHYKIRKHGFSRKEFMP